MVKVWRRFDWSLWAVPSFPDLIKHDRNACPQVMADSSAHPIILSTFGGDCTLVTLELA